MGLKPIVLERGGDVDSRKEAVDKFWQTGQLDVDNNVQFGEGGAGTFSDGKLTTRIKDPRCRKVLEEFVAAGAPGEILYDSKPHIGTDLLRGVVKEIRQKIISLGGEVRFFSKVTDIFSENGMVTAVEINGKERLDASDVVLALGHSARDTFAMLYEKGFALEQKPFAMGVRIEHPQEMVNVSQYGEAADQLPAADYRLTYTTKKGGLQAERAAAKRRLGLYLLYVPRRLCGGGSFGRRSPGCQWHERTRQRWAERQFRIAGAGVP